MKVAAPSKEEERIRKTGIEFARKAIDKLFERSKILDSSVRWLGWVFFVESFLKMFLNLISFFRSHQDEYPKFTKDSIKFGKVLGKGGFGTVYECLSFDANLKSNKVSSSSSTGLRRASSSKDFSDEDEVEQEQKESRQFIADHCIRKGGDARYALKILSPEVVNEPRIFTQGSIDMAVETRLLSFIDHPNIIKMRACCALSPYEVDYFIGKT